MKLELIIFDCDGVLVDSEPMSNRILMQMLQELHTGGSSVGLATHDPRYIALAPRHVYLFDGRLADTPESEGVGIS